MKGLRHNYQRQYVSDAHGSQAAPNKLLLGERTRVLAGEKRTELPGYRCKDFLGAQWQIKAILGLRKRPASILRVGSLPKTRKAPNPDSFPSQRDAQLQEAAAFGRNFVLRQRKANFLLEIDSLGVNPLGYDSDVKSPRSLAKGLLPGLNHLTCRRWLGRDEDCSFLLLSAFPVDPPPSPWQDF